MSVAIDCPDAVTPQSAASLQDLSQPERADSLSVGRRCSLGKPWITEADFAGASFHFPSESPHGYRNATDKPAKGLWVSTF